MPDVGKLEFAPDYKSKRKPKYPDMTERFKQLDRRYDLLKLEREVIEAAKKWYAAQGEYSHVAEVDATQPKVSGSWKQLRRTVDALIEFESSQQQIKK